MKNKIFRFISLSTSRKIQFVSNIFYLIKTQYFYKFLFKSVGKKTIIKKPMILTYEYISLGENCMILNDARIEGISEYSGINYKPCIVIGNNVSFGQRLTITAINNLTIGDGTLGSFDIMITDIDHEYQDIYESIDKQPLIYSETRIGENCFIGSGVKIQAGTILGQHCIVGANAVVRGHFPDYCVIVGVPAKIVKRYDPIKKIWRKTNRDGNFIDYD